MDKKEITVDSIVKKISKGQRRLTPAECKFVDAHYSELRRRTRFGSRAAGRLQFAVMRARNPEQRSA